MTTTIRKDDLDILIKRVRGLTNAKLLVGIPGDSPQRAGMKQPPNHLLGFWMEFGVPDKNIPARPFLIPGVASARTAIIKALKWGVVTSLKLDAPPDMDVVNAAMVRAGEAAVFGVKQRIINGPFVPLAPMTIRKRQEKASAAGVILSDHDRDRPLIDTAAMMGSVAYVIQPLKRK